MAAPRVQWVPAFAGMTAVSFTDHRDHGI